MINIEELTELVIANRGKKFVGTTIEGDKKDLRLFVSKDGRVCEYNKGSHKYGHYLCTNWYTDISVKVAKQGSDVLKARRFFAKVSKYLYASGLWSDMKKACDVLIALEDDKLLEYLNSDWSKQHKIESELGIIHMVDCPSCTIKKGIKSINYENYHTNEKQEFAKAIKERRKYDFSWRKGYDNSVSCDLKGDNMLAWYSEEYKNCGNGHYYLALDESHAIFCEDD